MAGSTQTLDDKTRLQIKFDATLDRLCEFYGVPVTTLNRGQVFGSALDTIKEDSERSVELAVVRSTLPTLREVGDPKLDFVSESQDEILALRVFFGLDQEAVAKALGLPLKDVQERENLSIVGLQQGICSEGPLSDNAVTSEVSVFDNGLCLVDEENPRVFSVGDDEGTGPTQKKSTPPKTSTDGEAVAVQSAVVSQAVGYKEVEKRSVFRGTRVLLFGLTLVLLGGTYVGLTRSEWFLNNSDEENQTAAATTTTIGTTAKPTELDLDAGDRTSAVGVRPEADVEQADTTIPETTVQNDDEPTTSTTERFTQPVSANGGFESNVVAAQGVAYYPEIAGWRASEVIEVWSNGHSGVESPGGGHFVELNSTGPNTMVTEISVSPSSVLQWSIDHRGRDGTDSMQVIFLSESGEKQTWLLQTGQQWRTHQFEYAVPADSSTITVQLVSVTAGSRANLVDNFKISLK